MIPRGAINPIMPINPIFFLKWVGVRWVLASTPTHQRLFVHQLSERFGWVLKCFCAKLYFCLPCLSSQPPQGLRKEKNLTFDTHLLVIIRNFVAAIVYIAENNEHSVRTRVSPLQQNYMICPRTRMHS